MTMVSLPNILFQVGKKGRRLSMTEFLSIKEFEGKRVDKFTNTSVLNTITETDIVTQTANAGKDMYLAEANINVQVISSANFNAIWKLIANGITIDSVYLGRLTNEQDRTHIFRLKSVVKVAAGEIIKITVLHSSATATRRTLTSGTLVLFEEITDETPQISSI